MRRIFPALLALAILTLTASAALAHGGGGPGGPVGPEGPGAAGPRPEGQGFGPEGIEAGERPHQLHGVVVSVDAGAGTLQVKLGGGPRHGEEAPEPETVTVKTDSDTGVFKDGHDAALGDLAAGDGVHVTIVAEAGSTRDEVLANPAWLIRARSPQALYGFAGAVTAVDAENGRLTLKVRYATKAARALIGAGQTPELTFTVDGGTECSLNRRRRGIELEDIDVGDVAAVAISAPKGSTLETVLATPAEATMGLTGSRAMLRRASRRKGLTALTSRALRAARG